MAQITSSASRASSGAKNLRNANGLEYMGFPRIIALAERAWAHSPNWAQIPEPATRNAEMQRDWNRFANRLGQRELPRLDYLCGGVRYRLRAAWRRGSRRNNSGQRRVSWTRDSLYHRWN